MNENKEFKANIWHEGLSLMQMDEAFPDPACPEMHWLTRDRVENGEDYESRWKCYAVDEEGNMYMVYWLFYLTKEEDGSDEEDEIYFYPLNIIDVIEL